MIQLLHLEDNKFDAELIALHLQKELSEHHITQVKSGFEFEKILKTADFDVILIDFKIPQFDGFAALEVIRKLGIQTPAIMVTGSVNEETAVDCLKAGAIDYILKNRLTRLVPAIDRAIQIRELESKKHQAEQALKEREELFRSLAEVSFDAIFIHQNGLIIECNEKLCKIFEYEMNELLNQPIMKLAHPESQNEIRTKINDEFEGEYEGIGISKNGRKIYMEIFGKNLKYNNINSRIVAIRDISDRKNYEQELARTKDQIQAVLDAAPVTISWISKDRTYLGVNKLLSDSMKIPVHDFVGKKVGFQKTSPEFVQFVADFFKSSRQQMEREIQIYNGKNPKTIVLAAQKYNNQEAGVFIGLNITEKKHAEKALQESEQLFRDLAEESPNMIWVTRNSRFIYVNKRCSEILGHSHEEFFDNSSSISNIISDESKELIRKIQSAKKSEYESTPFQFALVTKSGEQIEALGITKHITHKGKKALLGITTDITEFRKLEDEYKHAQKMEAIGRLAGGVAHDFNNLLTVILGYSELLRLKTGDSDPMQKFLNEISKAAKRAEDLTQQLLAFSRKQVMKSVVFNMRDLVLDMEQMLGRLIGEDIEFTSKINQNTGNLYADPGQIEQVIMNLVINARDAMPSGGKLKITAENISFANEFHCVNQILQPGKYIKLAVEDTGIGMDKTIKSKIFEPFFTTKKEGKGTGLGLATVFGIIAQSNGGIQLESEVNRGTKITLYLPLVAEAIKAESETEQHKPELKGNETILIVEDEDAVRDVTARILQTHGYQIMEASQAGDALLICEQSEKKIDLMITDVVMPRMSGVELFNRLNPLQSGMKVLFMSGYTNDEINFHGISADYFNFITKPFAPLEIVSKVRSILDK